MSVVDLTLHASLPSLFFISAPTSASFNSRPLARCGSVDWNWSSTAFSRRYTLYLTATPPYEMVRSAPCQSPLRRY